MISRSDSIGVSLFWLVVVTSAFGSSPTIIKFGQISASGMLTLIVAVAAIIAFFLRPKVVKRAIPALFGMMILCLLSLGSFFGLYSSSQEGLQNYVVVWAGILFIYAFFANPASSSTSFLRTFNKLMNVSTWVYLTVLVLMIVFKGQDPATALAGIAFFAFHLARLFSGNRRSMYVVLAIMLGHVLLGARIVVGADLILLLFGRILANGWSLRFKLTTNSIITLFVLFFGALVVATSGIIEQKFLGGDQGVEVAGMSINTSGRAYMWELVFTSWLESPWFGHGTPGPEEMLATPRWSHPHNDYLRLLHQLGVVGLFFWLMFFTLSFRHSHAAVKKQKYGSREQIVAHAASMAAIGLAVGMLTDNAIVYSYVVYPIAAMLGIAVALRSKVEHRIRAH